MPTETTPTTTETQAKPRRDAVGWALSGVTCIVLAIGVLVIRSTLPRDEDATSRVVAPEPDTIAADELISVDEPEETRPNEYITLEPSAPEPRQLPPTDAFEPSEDQPIESPPQPPLTVRRVPEASELKR